MKRYPGYLSDPSGYDDCAFTGYAANMSELDEIALKTANDYYQTGNLCIHSDRALSKDEIDYIASQVRGMI